MKTKINMKLSIGLFTIWMICLFNYGFASPGFSTYVLIKGNSEASKEFFEALYIYPTYPQLKQLSIPELIEGRWLGERELAFEFELNKPSLINIGEQTNIFYIKPGDSLIIDYKFIGFNDRGNLLEEWHIKGNQSLRLPTLSKLQIELTEIAFKSQDERQIAGIQSVNYLDSLSRKAIVEVVENNPKYEFDEEDIGRIHEHYFQINALVLIGGLSRNFASYSSSLANTSRIRILEIVKHISDQHISRNTQYYMMLERLYQIQFQKKWEIEQYDKDVIGIDLAGFDSRTQEYLRFCILKFDLYTADEHPGIVSALIQEISDPPLLTKAEILVKNIMNRKGEAPYLDADVGKALLKDVNGKEQTFASIFRKTNKSFIYFDFCGSWCVPCLQEMEKYVKSDTNHDAEHPDLEVVYIFFEKDDVDWKKVITQYNLALQNCYLVTDNELQSYFGPTYHWPGTFPHHSIFSKNGKLIHRNAPALLELKTQDYLKR